MCAMAAALSLIHFHFLLIVVLIFASPHSTATAASTTCSTTHTFGGQQKLLSYCSALGSQDATLAWSMTSGPNATLDVVFSGVAPSPGGWVGWGINPYRLSMGGTQAFIAFQAQNGSTVLTYDVTHATEDGEPLVCTPISLHVLDMAVNIVQGTSISIFVSMAWPAPARDPNSTVLNHIWNRGPPVSNFRPESHSLSRADLSARQAIDMTSGVASSNQGGGGGGRGDETLTNAHAILNTVGWGVLLPCGVIAARYLKPFADPAWFYAHIAIQMLGYALGVAGWATGMSLDDEGSRRDDVVKHRNIGIVIFAIATLQMMALFVRPGKDHKLRQGWNVYHYSLAGAILILGIINIFEGFEIMSPPDVWRRTYIGVLIVLGGIAIILEITTWIYVCRRRKDNAEG
ncbi:hypothetical protein KP509_19G021000 [Ceratopteris richardii]|nr:hypothetical protein KP509_19G021000 [Ceratopteris richardii]